jgi:hypothetical protein
MALKEPARPIPDLKDITRRVRSDPDRRILDGDRPPITEEGVMPAPDPDGQVSLMLCESILHILVEEGVISRETALDAINGVVELAREKDGMGQSRSASHSATQLIEAIARSFALKGLDEVTSLPAAGRGRPGHSRGSG